MRQLVNTGCSIIDKDQNRIKHVARDCRGRLSTVDLLVKIACFVTKVNNFFNIKSS